MNRLLLTGLNHTTSTLEVREKMSFTPARQAEALGAFRQKFPEAEAVLISTCNRVEMYVARARHGHPRAEELIQFLADFHSAPDAAFCSHLYQKSDHDVVGHLFSVAASLDSMVLGESQILGQVKSAYELALKSGTTGPALNPLFQKALSVGKLVHSTTGVGEGRISVASVAVDYAGRIFDDLSGKTVLSIGAGKMSVLVLRHFTGLKPGRLLVCNRDAAKAGVLAARFGGQAVPFERLDESLAQADVVITSTGSVLPIIDRAMVERSLRIRRFAPMLLIDIALPRDISPEVGQLEQVYLYNLDDLQRVVASTQGGRQDAADRARLLVQNHVQEYMADMQARQIGPEIDAMYKRYHALAEEELNRTLTRLPSITPDQQELLRRLVQRVVNKVLHEPVRKMRMGHRDASESETAEAVVSSVRKLDDLSFSPRRETEDSEAIHPLPSAGENRS